MLADCRTQRARWCLKKEREIILHTWKTEAELGEVLSSPESWAAYCFFIQIQSYTEERPEIRYYVRNKRTARCITCVLIKLPAEALRIFRILPKPVILNSRFTQCFLKLELDVVLTTSTSHISLRTAKTKRVIVLYWGADLQHVYYTHTCGMNYFQSSGLDTSSKKVIFSSPISRPAGHFQNYL